MRNLQEQVKKAFCYQKLFWPFTVWINCSSDLKIFENSWPSALIFKSFSRSLEQFFLTVGQNNFDNKIPFSFWTLPGQWLRQPCLPQHPFLPLCHHFPLRHYFLCHPPDPLDPLELEDCHPQRCQLQNHLLLLKVCFHHFHFLCSLHSKKAK